MLNYPNIQSPSDSMAQLVPCSAYSPPTSSDFGRSDSLEVGPMYESQVPSPSFAWTGSYWCERSPALYQPTPSPPSAQGLSSSPPPAFLKQESSASLEELLSDFTYDEPQYSNYGKFASEEAKAHEAGHALLRQCLRSTNQQQRCQLQYLNQLGSAIAFPENNIKTEKGQQQFWSSNSTNNSHAQGLASVLTMVMEQVNEEVRSTCEILGVSPDPSKWSADDVKAWLLWTSRQCALGLIPLERFFMDGSALMVLSEEEFRMRAPQGGDTLYAKLDIWRSAWQQRNGASQTLSHEQQSSRQPQLPTIQVDEACPDMSDLLAWIGSTQDVQQPGLLGNPGSQHLMVPSPASSLRTSSASPYSDHDRTLSGSEDFSSEVEEVDDDDEMDPAEEERSTTNGSSMSSGQGSGSNGSHIHLWQFLKELLSQPALHGSAIRWLDRSRGVFKIEDSVRVARLWGKRKNRPAMNYDKLSRSIRQYYRKGIMKKTERSQRLVYQFCHPYAL